MLKGMRRALDDRQMDRLHEGVLNVLARTGPQVRGDFLLRALADAARKELLA